MAEQPAAPAPAASHREPLTRERIVDSALAIIDAEGLDALSMRKLGGSLGVEAMAIYHHFPNKDAVLEGVIGRLLSLGADRPKGLDWRAGLKWEADCLVRAVGAHPQAVPLLVARPLNTWEAIAWIEGPLALLKGAGFSDRDAVDLFHAVLAYELGWVSLRGHSTSANATALSREQLMALAPTAGALGPLLSEWDRGFNQGLDALLDTWARHLPPGSRGAVTTAKAAPATAADTGGAEWIVQVGDGHGVKKKKAGKKKDKAKKHKG